FHPLAQTRLSIHALASSWLNLLLISFSCWLVRAKVAFLRQAMKKPGYKIEVGVPRRPVIPFSGYSL
ncbi:MAG: hypothetical protein K2K36_04280, partial [Muribaculaceae bacterium]|nr:hypothetical protein [Muribaculaceae bacterium]